LTGFLAALLLLTQQQAHASIDAARVARESVARFYSWYVPAAQQAGADMRALHDARWHFSPVLVSALRADSAATEANPSEIVGLDMDPFLNAQDPCDRYAPTAVRRDGKTFLVDVHGSGGCASHRETDVTVRVAFRGATPVFVNFIYPQPHNDDLLHLLAQLAADRAKKPGHGGKAHGRARSQSSGENARAIQAARVAYHDAELAMARGTWARRDSTIVCDSELPPFDVRLHRDSAGVIRRLEWSGGTEDHAETHRYYYDPEGRLRFAFFTLGAVNGTRYEERVYFARTGAVVRRLPHLVHGPGYAYPSETGIREPSTWRHAICN
jgi:YD repeat-containing protein